MLSKALTLAAIAAVASAQQPIWSQCGGKSWNGGTSCAAGLACSSINDYYYQCVSATAGSTTLVTSTKPGTTAVTTTARGTTTTPVTSGGATTSNPAATTTIAVAGNPFAGKQIYANPYYSSEVISLAVPSLTAAADKAKASKVANVGSFVWLDTLSKVPTMDTYLADIKAKNAAGASPPIIGAFVVYDLPDRDCAALASNGEYSIANGGVANYKNYIDQIVKILKKYPDVQVVLVVEPDSLANLVTNLGTPKCAGAASAYKECTTYAIQQLNLSNVAMYLDAGHAGWLGYPANIGPAAQLFGDLYKGAGSPKAVRGLATNVANYNAWSISSCPSYTEGAAICDEKRYINALAPLLVNAGFPAHFIMDTSRNGVQPTKQQKWGDWCNVIGTGFGVRPTTNTGDSLEDAFVWIKPGGEGDGTSDSTADRFDAHCGYPDALQPAPEAGTWFQAYFTQLLQNANPTF